MGDESVIICAACRLRFDIGDAGGHVAACPNCGRLWPVPGGRPRVSRRSLLIAGGIGLAGAGAWSCRGSGKDSLPRLRELASLAGPGGSIESLEFSPDGRRLLAKPFRVWDVARRDELAVQTDQAVADWLPSRPEVVYTGKSLQTRFVPPGKRLSIGFAVCSADSKTLALCGACLHPRDPFSAPGPFSVRSGFGGNSDRMGDVTLVDAAEGRHISRWQGLEFLPDAAAFSPDGSTLAILQSGERKLRLWDVGSGRERPGGDIGPIDSLVGWPSDGDLLFLSGQRLLRTDGKGGEPVPVAVATERVSAARLSADGRLLSAVELGDRLRLYEFGRPGAVLRFRGEMSLPERGANGLRDMAFSPDGRLLASGELWKGENGDTGATIWDWHLQKPIAHTGGHGGAVRAVAFSPDGRILATGGWTDDRVKLWDSSPL